MSIHSLSQLQEGMIVLTEVMDKHGHRLIAANEELNEKNIQLLKIWSVYEVDIKENNDFSAPPHLSQYTPKDVQKALDITNEKFHFHPKDDPGSIILKKIFLEQILEDETL